MLKSDSSGKNRKRDVYIQVGGIKFFPLNKWDDSLLWDSEQQLKQQRHSVCEISAVSS